MTAKATIADENAVDSGEVTCDKPEVQVLMLRFLDFALKGHDMPAPGNARGDRGAVSRTATP